MRDISTFKHIIGICMIFFCVWGALEICGGGGGGARAPAPHPVATPLVGLSGSPWLDS